jgi:hypothetical protein
VNVGGLAQIRVTAEPNAELLGEYAHVLKMANRAITAGTGSDDEGTRRDGGGPKLLGGDREESPPPWAARARIPDSRDRAPAGASASPAAPAGTGYQQPPPPPPPPSSSSVPSNSASGAYAAAPQGAGSDDQYAAYQRQLQQQQQQQHQQQQQAGPVLPAAPTYDASAYGYGYPGQAHLQAAPSREAFTGYGQQTRVEMSVPGPIVGMIIGRGGENVRKLEMDTRARIQFPVGTGTHIEAHTHTHTHTYTYTQNGALV